MPLIKDLDFRLPENFNQTVLSSVPGMSEVPGALKKINLYIERITEADGTVFFYRIFKCLHISTESISLNDGTALEIGNADKIFGSPELFAVYFATVGEGTDNAISSLSEKGMTLEAYLYKSTASFILKTFTDSCKDAVSEKIYADFGFQTGCSYSPGYKYWDISGQKKLFEMADPSSIGISLDHNFIMHPLITSNGILPAGKNVNEKSVPCDFCGKDMCHLRNCGQSPDWL